MSLLKKYNHQHSLPKLRMIRLEMVLSWQKVGGKMDNSGGKVDGVI